MLDQLAGGTALSAGGKVFHQTHSLDGFDGGPPGSSGTPVRTWVSLTVNSSPGRQKLSFRTFVRISRNGELPVFRSSIGSVLGRIVRKLDRRSSDLRHRRRTRRCSGRRPARWQHPRPSRRREVSFSGICSEVRNSRFLSSRARMAGRTMGIYCSTHAFAEPSTSFRKALWTSSVKTGVKRTGLSSVTSL